MMTVVTTGAEVMRRPHERHGNTGEGEANHRLLEDRSTEGGSSSFEIDASVLGLSEEVPSAQRLLRAQPNMSGYLLKKKERCLGICPCCFGPVWKRRFFIVCGQFLYRFASETGGTPKGVPIPLECATFRVVTDEVMPFSFVVSTLSKEMVLAAATDHERRVWIEQLREAKQRAIKEGMGHSQPLQEHVGFNRSASKALGRHSRKARAAASSLGSSGIEMRAFFSQL